MSSPLIVVPDCNVLIHGRSLHDLPWEEFGVDEIDVRLVGQVVTELDTLKTRSGRPSRIARDISTQLRKLLDTAERTEVIRAANPRVTRTLWLGKQEAKSPSREGLDLSHGDQAIISQVLAMADSGRDVLLLTDDVLAAAHASDFGAQYKLLPEDWRRPPEQDEAQKEISRLKTDNARLMAAEPKFEGWFTTNGGDRLERVDTTLVRYEALTAGSVAAFMARVEQAAPMANLSPRPKRIETGPVDLVELGARFERDLNSLTRAQIETYEADYAKWLNAVRDQLERLHLIRSRRREWPSLLFVAENGGVRPAEQTLVELEVNGDFHIKSPERLDKRVRELDDAKRRVEEHLTLPPRTPAPTRLDRILSTAGRFGRDQIPPTFLPPGGLTKHRDADAFYWREGREGPVTRMELECASWRHKREPEAFAFLLSGSDGKPLKGAVVATVSAANVSTPLVQRLPVRVSFETETLDDDAERMVSEFENAMAKSKSGT